QNDLERLKGKNIFSINIKKVQDKLELKYPQASELRVMRRFPNRIIIVAKERTPFVQIKVKDKYYVLDDKAVVLAVSSQYDKALPVIENFKLNKSQVNLGGIVRGRNIRVAIRIRTAFKEYMDSKKLSITRIDLKDISKINLYLSTELRIILDGDKLDKKIQVLNLVLTQKELNLKDVKYIDLRFKEPILGRK
ncbi:MAG: cell division septal protein FtsQ, partial [Lysobacterales bacterium]